MPVILDQQYTVSSGDTEVVSVNYTNHLDGSEVLTGTPTVVEITTAALTLDNKAVSTATYTESDTGDTIAIGKAVQFTVTTSTAGLYAIRVTASTDGSPARTFVRDIYIEFV